MGTIKCVYTVKKANEQPSNIAKQYFFAWLNYVAAASKTLKHRIKFSLQKWCSRKGYISLHTYRCQKHKTGKTTSDHCQRCRPLLTPPQSFFRPFPVFFFFSWTLWIFYSQFLTLYFWRHDVYLKHKGF